MTKRDQQYVLEQCREHRVKFVRLWFTDIVGMLKSVAVTMLELERAMEEGVGFDGSSIEGLARIEESDVLAMPDPNTFALMPWRSTESGAVARMFCDILLPEGSPHPGDPRAVLKRNLKRASELGYTFYVGPELEYFYFQKGDGSPRVLDEGGYFDQTSLDVSSDLRKDTILLLSDMGIDVQKSHHEVSSSQHEIDLRYCDALTTADNVMTSRLIIKEIANQHGYYASFMPKPLDGLDGSGMHVHQSLFRGEANAFFDPEQPYQISALGRGYMAGLLEHAPAITAVTNQWVNSYKRLVPGYEAPAYLCWGRRNRSALIRVPDYKPGRERSIRLELRSPDPATNPYLAFSVMLAAGLDGIARKIEPPPAVEVDVNRLTDAERAGLGITELPGNLLDAIRLVEKSEVVREALGDHCFERFIANKKIEWESFRTQVTDFEIKKYYRRL